MERPPRFPDVDWYCDHCGAHLNYQSGFDDHKYIWKCTNCGCKNSISRDNIRADNHEAINRILDFLDLMRTICMHCGLMTLMLLFFKPSFIDLSAYQHYPAVIYSALLVVTFLVILAAHFKDIGYLSALYDTVIGDIIRPYREVLLTGRIFFIICNHTRKAFVVWNIIKFIVYIAIIISEIGLFVYLCRTTYGSVGAALQKGIDWISRIDNLKDLYIPFMAFCGFMIVITFLAFGIDKYYAVKQKWRVKEPTLFTLSILFGAVGAVIGMLMFRHKINKPGFRVLLPILAVMQLVIIGWLSIQYFA